MWHPYKYVVTRCYSALFPQMMHSVHGKLPKGHEVPTARKLIFKERLFASMLVVANKVRDMLNLQFMAISGRARLHSVSTQLQLSQLTALKVLLYEYVRVVFLVATPVRDCYWGASTSQTPGDVLNGTLHIIMHLGLPHEHKIEYVRSIMVAWLLWSQWHEGLPPQAFSEEPCEALLSWVVHRLTCNTGAATFQRCFDEYLLVARASTEGRDRLLSGIPAGTVPHVERNVRALIQAVRQDVVPFARFSAQKAKIVFSWVWPEDLHFPPPLSQTTHRSHFSHLVCLFANTGHPK